MEDVNKLILVACLTGLPLVAIAKQSKEPAFVPAPMTEVDVIPGRPWDGKGAAEFRGPFADALKSLLAAGLPDPTGLPYRKLSIPTGNCYTGDDGVQETEAWLLPDEGQNGKRFAIAWNGLVYPVIRDHGKADLDVTLKALLKHPEHPFEPFGWQVGESQDATPNLIAFTHGLYLTKFGKIAAVETLLKSREQPPEDMVRATADDWAWQFYDRAVCAHMRGDAKLALASLREFDRIRPAVARLLAGGDDKEAEPLAWADQLDELKQECSRRLTAGKTGCVDVDTFLANKPEVPALIDALDRIAISQDGQPGDVPLSESKIVKALVAAGDKAVEPLLICLADDPRLTQSVHFWRSHAKSRTVLGVQEAALFALQEILHTAYFELASTGDSLTGRGKAERIALADTIRKDWEHYQKASGPERAYRILSDDHAAAALWLDAGSSLFHQPEYDSETGKEHMSTGPQPGEVLRTRSDPSVSELLECRAAESLQPGKGGESRAIRTQCCLLLCLLQWDPERGRMVMTAQTDRWLGDQKWQPEQASTLLGFVQDAAEQAPTVLRLFEDIVWTLDPDQFKSSTADVEQTITLVMARFADSPLLTRSRKGLWTDPSSPWCLGRISEHDLSCLTTLWLRMSVTTRDPFRAALLKALADSSQCGVVMIAPDDPKRWCVDTDDGQWGYPIPNDKRFALKPDRNEPLRSMDVVAMALNEKETLKSSLAPATFYCWSRDLRNSSIAELVKRLRAGSGKSSRKK